MIIYYQYVNDLDNFNLIDNLYIVKWNNKNIFPQHHVQVMFFSQ